MAVLETQIETPQNETAVGRFLYETNLIAEEQEFIEFTGMYWMRHGGLIKALGDRALITVDSMPEGLAEVDKYRLGVAQTTLKLDTGHPGKGAFAWHIDSASRTVNINRSIVISHDGLEDATLKFSRVRPQLGGRTEVRTGEDKNKLIKITRALATQALCDLKKPSTLFTAMSLYL
jgi:hypothetical protein